MYHPRLKGSHYDMGYHYGEIMISGGVDMNEAISLTESQREFAEKALPVYDKYIPDLLDEVKGLAKGSKVPFDNMFAWLSTMYGFGDIHGCTCFAFTDLENTILCRNSDMYPELKKTSESVLYRADGKNKLLGNSTSFIQLEDGINEHGLAVGMNFLLTKKYKAGINTGFLVRALLENCKDAEEAIKFIRNVPLCSTQNIMLADKSGNLAVVEASPEKIYVRRSNEYIISTNHFVGDEMKEEHANPEENWYFSRDRYGTCQNALMQSGKDKDFAMKLAGGKFGFTCQYEKTMNFDTLWSAVYHVNTLEIYRAEGNPSKTKYKEDTRLTWGMKK